MHALEWTQLIKEYRIGFWGRRVHALRGIDLSVDEGEVFGLIGPNGAGKSTAIKVILDLVSPTSGSARIFGVDSRVPEARRGVSYVPESPVPYEYLTGVEYVTFQAELAGLPSREVKSEVSRVIDRVEMARHARMPIRRYSKGMTQRIMLAGALLGRPRLVILDEPTSGLDPLGRKLVRDLLLELRAQRTTVLFCTHIISDVESLCDRAALLVGGRVQKAGRIDELVAGGAKTHEIVLERATAEDVQAALGPLALRVEGSGTACFVHVSDDELQNALGRLIQANLRVMRVQPEKFTLEDTFLDALKSTAGSVGASLE